MRIYIPKATHLDEINLSKTKYNKKKNKTTKTIKKVQTNISVKKNPISNRTIAIINRF